MLNDILKSGIKKTIPSILDKIGIYDNVINKNEHKLIVPMYHRIITDTSNDPFKLGMCVQSDTFESQLEYFSNNYHSVELNQYCTNEGIRSIQEKFVSITFDDGYKDNIKIAMPLLLKYNINAAFYICCSILTDNKEFWWDIIINSFANTRLKEAELHSAPIKLSHMSFNITSMSKRKICQALLNDLWKVSDISIIYDTAYYIEDVLIGHRQSVDKLNENDIKQLHNNGFEIAAHSLTHSNMKLIPVDMQLQELKKSKNILEDIIGEEVNGFAYPAGYQNSNLMSLAKDNGYRYAVGTCKGVNRVFNAYSIERFGVAESSVSDMKRSIYNYCKL